jgi:hypothetical protein
MVRNFSSSWFMILQSGHCKIVIRRMENEDCEDCIFFARRCKVHPPFRLSRFVIGITVLLNTVSQLSRFLLSSGAALSPGCLSFYYYQVLHTLSRLSQFILLSGAAHSLPAVPVSIIIRCCTLSPGCLSFYYYQVLHTLSQLSQFYYYQVLHALSAVTVLLLSGAARSLSCHSSIIIRCCTLSQLSQLYYYQVLHALSAVTVLLLSGAARSLGCHSSIIIRCCTLSHLSQFYYYQVLHTLSRLSQSPRALKMCKPGFPVTESSPTQDEEQIYK